MFETMKRAHRRLAARSRDARSRRHACPVRVEPLEVRALLASFSLESLPGFNSVQGEIDELDGNANDPVAGSYSSTYTPGPLGNSQTPVPIVQVAGSNVTFAMSQDTSPPSAPSGRTPDAVVQVQDAIHLSAVPGFLPTPFTSNSAIYLGFDIKPGPGEQYGDPVQVVLSSNWQGSVTNGDVWSGSVDAEAWNVTPGTSQGIDADHAILTDQPYYALIPGYPGSGFPGGATFNSTIGSEIIIDTRLVAGTDNLGYAILNASGQASISQSLTLSLFSATPAKPTLTVSVGDAEREYGQAGPVFTIYFSGLTDGDIPSSLGGSLSLTTSATTASDPGTYAVSVGGLTSDKYDIVYVPGTLTIDKADQTITWPTPADIGYGTPLGPDQLDATVTGPGPAPAGALTYDPPAGTILPIGPAQTLTVHAAGTIDYNPATATVPIDVTGPTATTQVTSSDPQSVYGQVVAFTATVTADDPQLGTPGGYVVFSADGVDLDTEWLVDGVATYIVSSLTAQNDLGVGTHTITARYSGDDVFLPSSGTTLQTVDRADTEVQVTSDAPLGSTYGDEVTFTATVSAREPGSGFPGGSVNFYDGGTYLGSGPIDAGVATFTTNALHAGHHAIIARYVGDDDFNEGESDPYDQEVRKAFAAIIGRFDTTTVYGQTLEIDANASPFPATPTAPTGYFELLDGTTPIDDADIDDDDPWVVFQENNLSAGTHRLTVVYSGDDDFESNDSSWTATVSRAPLTVAAGSTTKVYGQENSPFSATITGFVLGQGPGVLGGTLTFTTPATAVSHVVPGGYPITPGGLTSSNYAIHFVDGTLTITPAPLAITADNATKVYGAADPALTYRITAGQLIGGDHIGGALSRAPGEDVGDYPIGQGTLTAGNDYALSFVGANFSITPASTAATLVSSVNPAVVGQAVTFTASVAAIAPGRGVPQGTVRFEDGGVVIGSGTLINGVATFSTTRLAAGPHSITAVYAGSASFLADTSPAVAQTVLTAAQQVAVTQQLVRSYVDSGMLAANAASPLLTQLDTAATSLSRGNTTAGVNQLNASVNFISALMASGRLRRTLGQALIDAILLAIGAV